MFSRDMYGIMPIIIICCCCINNNNNNVYDKIIIFESFTINDHQIDG